LVLITAIMNGPTGPTSGSSSAACPGGCGGPWNPGVRPNGLIMIASSDGSFWIAAMVAAPLAAVPPERPPAIPRTRPFTRFTGPPSFAFAVSSQK
jgi:hypothetical protein